MKLGFLVIILFAIGCTKKTDISRSIDAETPPPKPAGMETIRAKANAYSQAPTPQARLKASMTILDLEVPAALPNKEEKIVATLEEAKQFATRVQEAVKKFESALGKEQVAYIVQDNPNALALKVGRFDTLSSQQGCTKEEFDKLKNSMGPNTLASRLRHFVELASSYESGYPATYATRALQVLQKDPKFADIRDEVSLYYSSLRTDALLLARERDQKTSRSSSIWRSKQLLEDSGVSGEVREQQLARLVKIAPSCFGKPDAQIQDWINETVTKTRGAFLLEKLRSRAWADLTADDLIEGDPIKGQVIDAWGQPFQKSKDEDLLRSAGPDHQFSTGDDVVISDPQG